MSCEPIGPGTVVLIVGPSGAGKDALLSGAMAQLKGDPLFAFPTRLVTRDASAAEDHETMTRAAFEAGVAEGAFALWWEAHGLGYALPASIDTAVLAGRVVVINASRGILGAARARYANIKVLLITAPEELRKQRILARGRESAEDVAKRLERSVAGFDADMADVIIVNDRTLAEGIQALSQAFGQIARGQAAEVV